MMVLSQLVSQVRWLYSLTLWEINLESKKSLY
ncbi:hypothetical protein OIU79_026771 [Salix purpurea]|uniref:Uncharacterized protein n=1 Tax=Salix purpurea TaxID=77065 RepID=A0A9Q1A118_SALPP|nr:hypothetical protein OIU79_026771 [Salix purpurea]